MGGVNISLDETGNGLTSYDVLNLVTTEEDGGVLRSQKVGVWDTAQKAFAFFNKVSGRGREAVKKWGNRCVRVAFVSEGRGGCRERERRGGEGGGREQNRRRGGGEWRREREGWGGGLTL